jgi:putative intracellular protease/amidase
MPDKAVYLLVVDRFADWEPAHAIAELGHHGGYRVETVGLSRSSVISMGGLCIMPSQAVDEIDPKHVAVLILPGGDRWETMPIEPELDSMSHVPEYREAPNYVDAPAVRDRGLITASGLGDVEFARELLEELDVLSPNDRAVWADMFRNARLPDETGA